MNNDKPYEYSVTGTIYGKPVLDNHPIIEIANNNEDSSFVSISMYESGRVVTGEFHVGTLSKLLEKFREDSWL